MIKANGSEADGQEMRVGVQCSLGKKLREDDVDNYCKIK